MSEQAEIVALRAENKRLRGWIASLDNEAEGLHQRLAAFADNNEALRERIAEAEAIVSELAELNTATARLVPIQDKARAIVAKAQP